MTDRTDEEVKKNEDEPRDRARRRLIKLGIYIVPAVTSMTAFLRRANAEAGAGSKVDVNPKLEAQTTANPQ